MEVEGLHDGMKGARFSEQKQMERQMTEALGFSSCYQWCMSNDATFCTKCSLLVGKFE